MCESTAREVGSLPESSERPDIPFTNFVPGFALCWTLNAHQLHNVRQHKYGLARIDIRNMQTDAVKQTSWYLPSRQGRQKPMTSCV